ncbi:hypothetical protein DFH28DRAFT_946682 [Melampsora americana]|nr:hypothetical protein DFH28DRAFT_946682 [Melampsora americana]
MKSFGISTLLLLVIVYIHTPEVQGSQLLVKRAKNDQKEINVFCAETGGKALNQKPTCKKTGSKEPKLICQTSKIPTSQTPTNGTIRGELQCTEKGTLEINFKDCDKQGKKPTKLFCELPPIPISCTKGAKATPLVNPPSISCVTKGTKGTKPTESPAHCEPSKEEPNVKFSGTMQCKKGETMTFKGTNSTNPCTTGVGILFCNHPADPKKTGKQ